ncbi:hypothetical protein CsSME_00046915 [Camellia sinensis var. sinensis]
MSALVSSWSKNVHTVPENFVCSSEERPGDLAVPLCKGIPVVDLQQVDGHDRADSIKQIMIGSQDFGMFQVINHGLLKELMDDTMSLFKEFFDMPEEDKATYYSEDMSKSFRLYTGSFCHSVINHNYWKDSVRQDCHPLEDHIETWPEKPARYREVVGTYSVEVRKLGLRILDLICEGLGVDVGYFAGDLSKFQGMIVNHYPPCPNPSLVLGVRGHYDTNLLTLLQQDEYGLQILKDGQWFGVKHVPNAFVINIGSQLEIISNGKLTSIKHRAVTNSSVSRTSIVTLINPSEECIIEPAKALVSACNPSMFQAVQCKEYVDTCMPKARDLNDATLES